jgi:integrase
MSTTSTVSTVRWTDYVFVNLWSEPKGRPWAYPAVYDLVGRLRERTGIDFGPHQYRHTYATWLLRRGAGKESVKELLGHASISTTLDTYGHHLTLGNCIRRVRFRRSPAERATVMLLRDRLDTPLTCVC